MKVLLIALTATLALTACGVDGPPVRPTAAPSATPTSNPNISVRGETWIGVRSDDL